MFLLDGKNKSLSYNILNKVYFANLITTIAIFCIVAFAINLKFDDIRENMHLSNKSLNNIILHNVKAVNNELNLLGRYVLSGDSNIKTVLDYSLNNSQEYYAVYILNSEGEIEISTLDESDANKRYANFFKSKPWENKFVDGFFRSEFNFNRGEIPTRIVAKDLGDNKILVAEIKLNYIYDELIHMHSGRGANSFIVDKDGKILFHQDLELVLKQNSIFDIYKVNDDYTSKNDIEINWSFDNFDLYTIGYIPQAQVSIVSYRSVKDILYSNWIFLTICAVFLFIGLFLIFIDVKFTKNGIVKPILLIKKLVKKVEKEENITQYVNMGNISDFNEIIESIVRIYENFQDKKNSFLDYEKKFGYLFEQGPLAILLIDANTGDIIDASSKALEFYGFSKDEILKKRLQDLDAAQIRCANIITCDYNDGTMSYETKQVMSNGDIKDVLIKKKNIATSGNKLGFCLIEDVTWDKITKRNFAKENEANIHSPIFKISWKNSFLKDILSISFNTERILGYKLEDMLNANFSFKNIIHEDDFDRILNEFNIKLRLFNTNLVKREYEFLSACRLIKKNLEIITCSVFIKFVSDDEKNIDEVIGYFVDNSLIGKIDASNNAKQPASMKSNDLDEILEYKFTADKYKKITSNLFQYAQEAMAILGTDGKFIDINGAFSEITGYSKEEVIGRSSNLLNSSVHDRKFFANLWQSAINDGYWKGHIWNKKKNGEKYLELLTISAIYGMDGNIENFIAIFSDVSNMRAKEEKLEQIAYYDALTKLPNRFLFSKKLNDAMKNALSTKTSIAVIYIDIDDFKPINDLYGHTVGDQFLIEITKNISGILKRSDILARVGGDEFIAIIDDLTYKNQINEILEDILRAANKDIVINNKRLRVSVSIGASLYPQKVEIDQDVMIEQADWAMYQSKLSGKNKYYIFDPETDKYFRDNYTIADRISISLANDEFSLLYQPILNIKTNEIKGLDTFIARKTGNTILCEEILPTIAQGYIYDDLVIWNIKNALQGQSVLSKRYGLNIKVGVSVTLELINRSDFIDKFISTIQNGDYDNIHMLEFNIKDASSFKQICSAETLNVYKNQGVTLTLDQFGSNSASLQILKDMQIDKLKVSKYLSLGIVREVDSLIILKAILSLSGTFSKETIAKGVETSESMYLLIKAGYENMQGGFIAPAMKLENIKTWLESYEISDKLRHIEPLKEKELIWCNLAVMHRGWIKSLLDMLSASNLSRFDTKDFAKEYNSMMIEAYKKYIADTHKVAIHVEITDIIMQILTNIESDRNISKLVFALKEKRDKILNLD